MSDPKQIRNWFDRALELAARVREARETFNDMKKEDRKGEIDWASLKALAVAHDADLHDEKNHGRVKKLLSKRTYASWYADINGIGEDEQNIAFRSSSEIPDRPAPSDKPRNRARATAGTDNRAVARPIEDGASGEGEPLTRHGAASPSGAQGTGAMLCGDQYDDIPEFLRRPFIA